MQTADDVAQQRRVRVFSVPDHVFFHLFAQAVNACGRDRWSFFRFAQIDMPPDAVLRGVEHCFSSDCWLLKVSSAQFPEVEPGARVETIPMLVDRLDVYRPKMVEEVRNPANGGVHVRREVLPVGDGQEAVLPLPHGAIPVTLKASDHFAPLLHGERDAIVEMLKAAHLPRAPGFAFGDSECRYKLRT